MSDEAESEKLPLTDVWEAIRRAEKLLPGQAAAEEENDPRWQAIIKIGEFIREEPHAIWPFILRWGTSPDEDLRDAVATCLLEHLLQHHFARFFPRVEETARKDPLFAKTFLVCWKFGQAAESGNAERFIALQAECRESGRSENK